MIKCSQITQTEICFCTVQHAIAKECGLGVIVAHGHKRKCSRYLGSFGGQGQGKSEAGFG